MRIIRASTIAEILECVPIEMDIRKKEMEHMKLKDMLAFLETQLEQPFLGFYIAYEKEQIVGFMVLFYIPIRGLEQVQIMRIWYDHHYPKVMDEFEQIIRQWKRETKAPKVTVSMDTMRNGRSNMGRINALRKKWGFSIVSVELERRK